MKSFIKLKPEQYYLVYDMLFDYITELNSIDERVSLRTKNELIFEYFYTQDTDFYLFLDDDTSVGFAIIGHDTNCHEDVNIYIEEFYIAPKYRRNHRGFFFAKQLIAEYKSVCFFILQSNLTAISFWNQVFESNNWIPNIYIQDTSNAPKWLIWNVYERM